MTDNIDIFARGCSGSADAPYEYLECGLQGIFLRNGFERRTICGDDFVAVTDTESLHRVIGTHIVRTRKKLAPEEVRFLRKDMKLTQSELGSLMGIGQQTVARWEKGEVVNVGSSDRLLRVVYLGKWGNFQPDDDVFSVLKEIDGIDELTPYRIQLYIDEQNSWQRGSVRRMNVG